MRTEILNPRLPSGLQPRRQGRQALASPVVRLDWPALLTAGGLFGLFVALLAAIQFATPNLVDNDGYYHLKLAQVMGQQGLRPPFPWLPLSILNPATFVDHHFLYHVLLIPFTYGDLRLGAKVASVIFPALAFLAGWVLLRGQRVPYAALWSVGFLAVSEAFLYRMSMPRAQAVSLLVLFLALHLSLTRRYRWLGGLAFLYVWLYDAFPLMLLLVGIYVGTRWLLEGRLEVAPLVYTGLGLGLGLLVNPYFPQNLVFVYHHLFPKLADTTAIQVGNEWYPYSTGQLLENSGLALLAFLAGIVALGLQGRRMDARTATVLAVAVLFGVMLFKSRRFIEYFPPFALVFAAIAWAPLLERWRQGSAWLAALELPLDQFVNRLPHLQSREVWRGRLLAGLMVAILLPAVWLTVQAGRASLQSAKPYQLFAGASAWLAGSTPAGSRVFQTDWDDFPRLFFYNSHNTYTIGLDPTYMQLYDPDLYDLWVKITRGQVKAPARIIARTFGAAYVITDLQHKDFLRVARADPGLREVYRDRYAVVFEIVSLP